MIRFAMSASSLASSLLAGTPLASLSASFERHVFFHSHCHASPSVLALLRVIRRRGLTSQRVHAARMLT